MKVKELDRRGRIILTESLAEQVAPLILELDRLQEEQLNADILASFSREAVGRFSSLNTQSYEQRTGRRQERRIELQAQLKAANYEYKPLQFPLEFYITPFYTKKELARFGNPKQKYRVTPKGSVPNQSGCKHAVQAATLLEGSEKALAEHKENCLTQ